MTWWFRRKAPEPVRLVPRSKDAGQALERAMAALEAAQLQNAEMQADLEIVRQERAHNHFGPVIYQGMMRGKRDQQ